MPEGKRPVRILMGAKRLERGKNVEQHKAAVRYDLYSLVCFTCDTYFWVQRGTKVRRCPQCISGEEVYLIGMADAEIRMRQEANRKVREE